MLPNILRVFKQPEGVAISRLRAANDGEYVFISR